MVKLNIPKKKYHCDGILKNDDILISKMYANNHNTNINIINTMVSV